jgi:hypothetical protein
MLFDVLTTVFRMPVLSTVFEKRKTDLTDYISKNVVGDGYLWIYVHLCGVLLENVLIIVLCGNKTWPYVGLSKQEDQ